MSEWTGPGPGGPMGELDLWHPTGAPRRRLELGGVAGSPLAGSQPGAVDIVVIAPTSGEMSRAWIDRAAATAAAASTDDAVVWMIVSRRWRRAAERALDRSGLPVHHALVTMPPWPETSHLIPIAPAPLADAAERHRRLAPILVAMLRHSARSRVGRYAIRRAAPGSALVAARAGCHPLAWLVGAGGGSDAAATATVGTSTRNGSRSAVVMRYPVSGRVPDMVAKVGFGADGRARLDREREMLRELGPGAAAAGALVPSLLPTALPWMLATDVLPGRSATTLLARAPGRLDALVETVVGWLTAWNRATAIPTTATPELLDSLVLRALRRVTAADPSLAAYQTEVESLAHRMSGRRIILAAAHRDLTMANLMDADGRLGVVDWEDATPAGLPLTDLWYALVDGLAQVRAIERARALEALVRGDAPPRAAGAPGAVAAELSLSPDEQALAFHACWLHHAANELDRGGGSGEFFEVVRAIAVGRVMWPSARAIPQAR